MNNSDLKFINNWNKVRKRGFLLYLLRNESMCFLGWFLGCLIGLFFKLKTFPTMSSLFIQNYSSLLGFLSGGIIGSFLWWYINEEKYKELK